MAVSSVGSGRPYSTIAIAVTAARDGDTIDVDAGTYTDDYASIRKNITLQGVGGMAKLVSAGPIPNGKAIFIVNGDATINNFESAGAQVSDNNRESIRFEGGNHILNDCYFHDNQEAMLTGSSGTLTINNSEFAYNGIGNGQMHIFYAGKLANLTINSSYFHDTTVGREIKGRAPDTTITNSRICDLRSTASLSIDLSNGGDATIENNVIQQGPNTQNGNRFLATEPALDTTSRRLVQMVLSIGVASNTGSSITDNVPSNPAVKGTPQTKTAVTITESTTTLGTTTADSTEAWSFTPPASPMACTR